MFIFVFNPVSVSLLLTPPHFAKQQERGVCLGDVSRFTENFLKNAAFHTAVRILERKLELGI